MKGGRRLSRDFPAELPEKHGNGKSREHRRRRIVVYQDRQLRPSHMQIQHREKACRTGSKDYLLMPGRSLSCPVISQEQQRFPARKKGGHEELVAEERHIGKYRVQHNHRCG